MRDLEKTLLTLIIMQKLNRDNVTDFLNLAHSKWVQKKAEYKLEEIVCGNDSEDDDDGDCDVDEQDGPQKSEPQVY